MVFRVFGAIYCGYEVFGLGWTHTGETLSLNEVIYGLWSRFERQTSTSRQTYYCVSNDYFVFCYFPRLIKYSVTETFSEGIRKCTIKYIIRFNANNSKQLSCNSK